MALGSVLSTNVPLIQLANTSSHFAFIIGKSSYFSSRHVYPLYCSAIACTQSLTHIPYVQNPPSLSLPMYITGTTVHMYMIAGDENLATCASHTMLCAASYMALRPITIINKDKNLMLFKQINLY